MNYACMVVISDNIVNINKHIRGRENVDKSIEK